MSEPKPPSFTERANHYDLEHAAKLGRILPSASARALERVLPLNPEDIVNRARLLGHYWMHYQRAYMREFEMELQAIDRQRADLRVPHILWFIENAPDCVFAGDLYLSASLENDSDNFNKIRSAWKKQVKLRPRCTQTRVNYALFLFKCDDVACKEILNQVLELEPLNEWALALLPELGDASHPAQPLAVHEPISQQDRAVVRERVEVLNHYFRNYGIRPSLAVLPAVRTLVRVVARDPLDVFARLNIVWWCADNLQRVNQLGFDPKLAQLCLRHLLWLMINAPEFDMKLEAVLPPHLLQPLKDAFVSAMQSSTNKLVTATNGCVLFKANVGAHEARSILRSQPAWRQIDAADRRQLLRDLNWPYRFQPLLEREINLESVCDQFNPGCQLEAPPTVSMDLNEWFDDISCQRIRHFGFRAPPETVRNIDAEGLRPEVDAFGPACLVGFQGSAPAADEERRNFKSESFWAKLFWLMENAAESRYTLYVSLSPAACSDASDIERVAQKWQQLVAERPERHRLAENAILWFAMHDREAGFRLAKQLLIVDPANVQVRALMPWLSAEGRPRVSALDFYDPDFELHCDQLIACFKQVDDQSLSRICDQIDLYRQMTMDSFRLPFRSLLTNEMVLDVCPNDIVLRWEILTLCFDSVWSDAVFPLKSDPQILRRRTRHVLWLLENAPLADLYWLTNVEHCEG